MCDYSRVRRRVLRACVYMRRRASIPGGCSCDGSLEEKSGKKDIGRVGRWGGRPKGLSRCKDGDRGLWVVEEGGGGGLGG